jgi:1-acyl-sn-glycerol-3-phosphate acyltransferase
MNTYINILIILKIIILLLFLNNNTCITYIKCLFISISLYPGSYLINLLNDDRLYWNYILNTFFRNKIKYKNRDVIKNIPNGVIIISNHIQMTDSVLIRSVINCHTVANIFIKEEYSFLISLEKQYFNNLKLIPYIMENLKSGKKVKKNILSLINNNKNVLVFPEGITQKSCDNGILKFKKGLFYLAHEHNIPILPIILYYEDNNYGIDKGVPVNYFNLINNNSNIYVHINENIIYPKDYNSVNNLITFVHNKMSKILNNYKHKLKN